MLDCNVPIYIVCLYEFSICASWCIRGFHHSGNIPHWRTPPPPRFHHPAASVAIYSGVISYIHVCANTVTYNACVTSSNPDINKIFMFKSGCSPRIKISVSVLNPLEIPGSRWYDNIKWAPKKQDVDWIHLAQDMDTWPALANTLLWVISWLDKNPQSFGKDFVSLIYVLSVKFTRRLFAGQICTWTLTLYRRALHRKLTRSVGQEIPCLLNSPKGHYPVHRDPRIEPILTLLQPSPQPIVLFPWQCVAIMRPLHLSPKWSLPCNIFK